MPNYPADCNTPGERMAWLERAEEKLRLVHLDVGRWHREGLTQAQYNQLPAKVRNKHPYVAQLSAAAWRKFLRYVFEPVRRKISIAKNIASVNAKEDATTWQPDLDGDIS